MNINSINDMLVPAFSEKNVPVFCSTDENFVPYCGVMLQSIIDNTTSAYNYDLIVLHSKLSEKGSKLLTSLAEGKDNISIRLYDVSMLLRGKSFPHNDVYSLATWYRLFASTIFAAYNKIIYLDVDMVVLTDIAELFCEEIGESWLGGSSDLGIVGDAVQHKTTPYYLNTVGVADMAEYINAGMLVFNIDRWRIHEVEQACIQNAHTYQFRHNDQDTLNRVCHGHIHYLDIAWNIFPDRGFKKYIEPEKVRLWEKKKAAPFIIHYVGEKPWDNPFSDMSVHWWQAAAHTPYYDELQRTLLRKLIGHVVNYKRDMRRYRIWRFFSIFTFGKLRKRLTERKRSLRRHLRIVRDIMKWM